jgi:flagellar basal-body rod modification protein FlgD
MVRPVLSNQEKAQVAQEVERFNREINPEKRTLPNQNLGKDDFLKILLKQLSYQDPMAPMEDKEFIAQMAQFSSLEQMNNMAADFARMTSLFQSAEASGALGKSVELFQEDEIVSGTVRAVTRDPDPRILVNGIYYQWDQVTRIYEE